MFSVRLADDKKNAQQQNDEKHERQTEKRKKHYELVSFFDRAFIFLTLVSETKERGRGRRVESEESKDRMEKYNFSLRQT